MSERLLFCRIKVVVNEMVKGSLMETTGQLARDPWHHPDEKGNPLGIRSEGFLYVLLILYLILGIMII